MATYRVKPGFRFGAANQYGPSDLVELPADAASAFLDKLEPVVAVPAQPDDTQTEDDEPQDTLPQDDETPAEEDAQEDAEGEPLPIYGAFPGAEHLTRAGFVFLDDVPRDRDALIAVRGIGEATADAILAALASLEG